MRTRLFINNQEVELDESVQFAITKQFEDLSNPTTIINSWSKTVSIPFTEKNNILFGHIYNADRLIAEGGTSITGIYFNPYKKLDFRLQWGDSVLMVGYAKMNEVKQNNGKGTYEITLFGELGKVFQDLKKITFDTTTTEPDYLISGDTWVDEKINKDLVYNSWTSSGQTHEELYPKYFYPAGSTIPISHPAYRVTDIIGFAPNNSFSENFKYDTYQVNANISDTFENYLGTGFTEDTGVEPKTVIPNGLLPREYGEYRSYLQLPYIYWNKLFKIFQSKAESVTGYQFELDNTWFTSTNPYWYNLVYMLKPFETKDNKDGAINYYDMGIIDTNTWWQGGAWMNEKSGNMYAISTSVETYKLLNVWGWGNTANFYFNGHSPLFVTFNLGLELQADKSGAGDNDKDCYFASGNALTVTAEVLKSDGTVVKSGNVIIHRSTYTGSTSGYDVDMVHDEKAIMGTGSQSDNYFRLNPQLKFYINKDDFGSYFYFRLKFKWVNNTTPFIYDDGPQSFIGNLTITTNNGCTIQTQLAQGIKSNSEFTLNDLWNNDYNIFEEIIRYCKMYRISISVDELNKKIVFKPFNKYFENYTVEDWTDKVDKSKDYTITPITFENKYVLFDYKDSETKLGKEYKEKYGVNYGEYRLTTDYNFNTETKKLFEKVPQSIINTDTVLSYMNLYYHKIEYSFPAELYVYNKDKDNKQKDIFGSFFFHCGLKSFDIETRLHLMGVCITDDSDFQLSNNTYFYNRELRKYKTPATYPFLDIINGNYMCLFNIPKVNYTYLNNYTGKKTIYSCFWQNYINERYNIQNKKITCYVRLKPTEYQNFEWNHFVKIGNQLCIVNKIYDYDVTSNQPVKVDLITIQDISGYTTNNY